MNSPITTHILDTSRGCPAAGVEVILEAREISGKWQKRGHGTTDADGRIGDLLASGSKFESAEYRLIFAVAPYFQKHGVESFYPKITVTFRIEDTSQHYHVPLLLNPFGYSTYRGS